MPATDPRDLERNDAPAREETDLTASGLEYIGDYSDDFALTYSAPVSL